MTSAPLASRRTHSTFTQAEIYYKTVRFYVETPKSFGPVKFSTSFGGINISVASLQLS